MSKHGWHDHPIFWRAAAKACGLDPRLSPMDAAFSLQRRFGGAGGGANTSVQVFDEVEWTAADRPYYDIYPSVIEAFSKVDLGKLAVEQIRLQLPQLLIRFPIGHEFQASSKATVRSILVGERGSPSGARGWVLAIDCGAKPLVERGIEIPIMQVNGIRLDAGSGTVLDHINRGRTKNYCNDEVDWDATESVAKLVCTLCLLKNDPDLIEPEPLAADRAKWDASHDPKLLEKAQRRGKRAWAVGKQIEVAPGFRRPHFAIRWMGKGRVDPRLRPIKGCLVRREKITEVPTDYLGPELETA